MNWLLRRLAIYAYQRALEASTWRNLILLAGGTWSARHPEQAELLVPVCLALAGLIGSVFPDLLGSTRLEARLDETVSALPPIELQGRAGVAGVAGVDAGVVRAAADELRQPVPAEPDAEPDRNNGGWNG